MHAYFVHCPCTLCNPLDHGAMARIRREVLAAVRLDAGNQLRAHLQARRAGQPANSRLTGIEWLRAHRTV
jgi:hypothetical protein